MRSAQFPIVNFRIYDCFFVDRHVYFETGQHFESFEFDEPIISINNPEGNNEYLEVFTRAAQFEFKLYHIIGGPFVFNMHVIFVERISGGKAS